MSITPEFIAAITASVVFAVVLVAIHSASARRQRKAGWRQWQADLRTRGA